MAKIKRQYSTLTTMLLALKGSRYEYTLKENYFDLLTLFTVNFKNPYFIKKDYYYNVRVCMYTDNINI